MATLILNVLILAGTALLCVRLYASGLYHKYLAFFCFLIFYALQTGLVMSLDPSSGAYQKAYVLTEPIAWIFYALVVLELYSLILKDFRGLYTVGRWALMIAVAAALAGSALIMLLPSHETGQGRLMAYYYLAQRTVSFSLVVFLLSILGFMMQYPITLSRNVILHSIVYTFYFLSSTVVYLVLGLADFKLIWMLRYALLAATLAAVLTWLVRLNPAGEEQRERLRPVWMPGREEELIEQLQSLNKALLRTGRK